MGKAGGRLSYANVVATVALFLALCGGAYAVGLAENSVGSRQIKPNAVKGGDAKEGSFGEVPSAADSARLGGLTDDQYVRQDQALSVDSEATDADGTVFLQNAGNLELRMSCEPTTARITAATIFGSGYKLDFEMVRALNGTQSEALNGSTDVGAAPVTVLPVLTALEGQFVISSGTFTFRRPDEFGAVVTGTYSLSVKTTPTATTCRFTGNLITGAPL